MNRVEPPYRASLEHAIAQRKSQGPPAPASPIPAVDVAEFQRWARLVRDLDEALRATPPAPEALAEATRHGRLGKPGDRVPNQVFLLTRGLNPITTRFFAALAASDLDTWGCTIFDTGMPDDDAARLVAFFRNQGIEVSMYRGKSMEIASPDYMQVLWGGTPRYVLIINDDTIPTPGFCGRLTRPMENDPKLKIVSAISNTPLDSEIYRPGFEEGPDETLLERVWNFAHLRHALHGETTGRCVQCSFTCAALDWDAWRAAMPMPTPFDFGHHFDLHCGFSLLEAGYRLGTAEGCAIYHIGHVTYRCFSDDELYNSILERTRKFIDVWGHRPELPNVFHAILASATTFSHH